MAVRQSAEQRRKELLDVAAHCFAQTGLHGTSTAEIARQAGISHAYLFRLFPTKLALFLACSELCFARTLDVFRLAAEECAPGATPQELLDAMGGAYVGMLADRDLLLGQMQMYAACSEPEVRAAASRYFASLREYVAGASGADAQSVLGFFALGMLHNVAASLELPQLVELAEWQE